MAHTGHFVTEGVDKKGWRGGGWLAGGELRHQGHRKGEDEEDPSKSGFDLCCRKCQEVKRSFKPRESESERESEKISFKVWKTIFEAGRQPVS